ncbi:hypothetical protein BDR04DRAFT_1154236 [Suillus decipiens]|nr:hypothetical protein BDR04DRAFT_1154236 [Suillus decipiens]
MARLGSHPQCLHDITSRSERSGFIIALASFTLRPPYLDDGSTSSRLEKSEPPSSVLPAPPTSSIHV